MKLSSVKNKRKPGFTLVEMVIVVTIIGILSGLGFMKFDKVQAKARENADYVAATNLATAANLYKQDTTEVIESLSEGNVIRKIELQKLKDNNYINIIPKPQSLKGEFLIVVNTDDSISVKVGEKTLYPKDEKK